MTEQLLEEIDKSEKKIEWTLDQLKPGRSSEERSKEAINLLEEIEEQELALEKKEAESKSTTFGERIALFYIKFFGSFFFIILFVIFIAAWIGLNYYLIIIGQNSTYNLALLNTIMLALALIQLPFIIISLRLMRSREIEKEEIDYERERMNLKLSTLNAEEIKDLEFEHDRLTTEHEDLRKSIERIQDSLDAINKKLGVKVEKHKEEKKKVDEEFFETLKEEVKTDDGRARIIDMVSSMNKSEDEMPEPKHKSPPKLSVQEKVDEKPTEPDFVIRKSFMDDFKKEIEELKDRQQVDAKPVEKATEKKLKPEKLKETEKKPKSEKPKKEPKKTKKQKKKKKKATS